MKKMLIVIGALLIVAAACIGVSAAGAGIIARIVDWQPDYHVGDRIEYEIGGRSTDVDITATFVTTLPDGMIQKNNDHLIPANGEWTARIPYVIREEDLISVNDGMYAKATVVMTGKDANGDVFSFAGSASAHMKKSGGGASSTDPEPGFNQPTGTSLLMLIIEWFKQLFNTLFNR